MIRVLIADDHVIVRKGLKQIVSETEDMTVAAEAGNGQEVLDAVRANEYDVVLLDISMPGVTGLEALKQLRTERPKLPVLILSIHPEEQYAIRVLKAGASGYLTKASAPDELVTAIRTLAAGRKYITPSIAERLAQTLMAPADGSLPHEALSDREHEVLCLIGRGKTVGEIAKELFLSPKTVSTYRTRLLEKMGMKNNAELMRYALEHGLT